KRPANCLQVRLRDRIAGQLAPDDFVENPLRVFSLLLFLGHAGGGDLALGEAPLLRSLTPMLVDAAAEAVAGTPVKVLLDATEPQRANVGKHVWVRTLSADLLRLADGIKT